MKPDYYQNIWAKSLSQGEETKYEFLISGKYIRFHLIVWGIICGLLAIPTFGVFLLVYAAVFFYFGYYLKVANAFAFTNKRVLIHRGWLSTSLISIDYNKITDIRIDQGFSEKLFYKTGSMTINTAGTGQAEVILRNIDSPYEVKKQLEKIKS